MAVTPRLTEQMPFVGTPTQRARVEAEATERRCSLAEVIRLAVDARYNLVDGEDPDAPAGSGT